MLLLSVDYHIKGSYRVRNMLVKARNAKHAKRKIEKFLKQKIVLDKVSIAGYF